MKSMVIGFGIVILGGGLLAAAASAGRPSRAASDLRTPQLPAGHEEPVAGGAYLNGFNVRNVGSCAFGDRYGEAQGLLGPPVGSFTGRAQAFQFGRLICAPTNPAGRQVLLDDLGLQHLRLAGLTPRPGSELHPAVRAHLLDALETGLAPDELFGRVLTPVRCDSGHHCRQYTDKQLLLFEDAPDALVRWAPLGCLLDQVCQQLMARAADRSAARTNRSLVLATGGVGLAVILLGGGTLAQLRRGRRGRGATI